MSPTLSANAPSEEKGPQTDSHSSKAPKSWYQKMGYCSRYEPTLLKTPKMSLLNNTYIISVAVLLRMHSKANGA
jgi:hypothetical protein